MKSMFENDLKTIIINEFEYLKTEHSFDYEDNIDVHSLLVLYYDTFLKLIVPKKRKVYLSNEICTKISKNIELKKIISLIKEKFEKGINVNPHLNKGIFSANYSGNKNRSKDGLLFDWRIYHLHLNDKLESNSYFIKRSGSVLLVYFDQNDTNVYFLNTMNHGKGHGDLWTNRNLLRIIRDNWSQEFEKFKIPGVIGLSCQLNEKEHASFRKNDINVSFELDGDFLMSPMGGISLKGTFSYATIYANRLFHLLIEVENEYKKEIEEIFRNIDTPYANKKDLERLKLISINDNFGKLMIIDSETNFRIFEPFTPFPLLKNILEA